MKIRELLNQLTPYDVVGAKKKRHGVNFDGGYVIIDGFEYQGVYSYGVAEEIEFELSLAQDCPAPFYLFDHTIESLPAQHERFRWTKQGVGAAAKPGIDSLENHLMSNGDERCDQLFLKMDVEGDEWETLEAISRERLRCFRQMVIEFHRVGALKDVNELDRQIEVLARLNESFRIVHVHHNNFSEIQSIDGMLVPEVLEVTLLRDDLAEFRPNRTVYPILGLDYPNVWQTRYRKYSPTGDRPLTFFPFAPKE